MPVDVITLEHALASLDRSGPDVFWATTHRSWYLNDSHKKLVPRFSQLSTWRIHLPSNRSETDLFVTKRQWQYKTMSHYLTKQWSQEDSILVFESIWKGVLLSLSLRNYNGCLYFTDVYISRFFRSSCEYIRTGLRVLDYWICIHKANQSQAEGVREGDCKQSVGLTLAGIHRRRLPSVQDGYLVHVTVYDFREPVTIIPHSQCTYLQTCHIYPITFFSTITYKCKQAKEALARGKRWKGVGRWVSEWTLQQASESRERKRTHNIVVRKMSYLECILGVQLNT